MPSDATALGEFSVSTDYLTTGTALAAATHVKIGDTTTECAADFVVIPQGTLSSSATGAAKDR